MITLSSTILKGRQFQKIGMVAQIFTKNKIVQLSNHLRQIAQQNGVASLSANQIRNQSSMFVILSKNLLKNNKFNQYNYKSSHYDTFINPKILDYSINEHKVWQQNSSYPNIKFLINRSTHIIVEYTKTHKDKAVAKQQIKNFESVLFQHQMNNLQQLNPFDLAQQVELIQNKFFKVNNQQKLKEQFSKFKMQRQKSKNIQKINNNNQKGQIKQNWYKQYKSLKNFVEYEIIDPV